MSFRALALCLASLAATAPCRALPTCEEEYLKDGVKGAFLDEEIESLLSRQPGDLVRELDEGSNSPQLLLFHRGVQGVFKPASSLPGAHSSKFELIAYRLDRRLKLGVVPVTVEGSFRGQKGTIQRFVEGLREGRRGEARSRRKMNLLDFLLSNTDRDARNWGVDASGHYVAFDNGAGGDWNKLVFSKVQKAGAGEIDVQDKIALPAQGIKALSSEMRDDLRNLLLKRLLPDRETLIILKNLSRPELEQSLKGLASPRDLDEIWARRNFLVEQAEILIREKGEAFVFGDVKS